jgi:hypothetical protein
MSRLHSIRKVSDITYELDIEWGDDPVRGWYRMDFDDGIIVPRLPLEFTHLHGWLVRPLAQAFAAYLKGERLEFPIDLGPP